MRYTTFEKIIESLIDFTIGFEGDIERFRTNHPIRTDRPPAFALVQITYKGREWLIRYGF